MNSSPLKPKDRSSVIGRYFKLALMGVSAGALVYVLMNGVVNQVLNGSPLEQVTKDCESISGEFKTASLSTVVDGDRQPTGPFRYCSKDGEIIKVYSRTITKPDDGSDINSLRNRKIFEECSKLDGSTFYTNAPGRPHHRRDVCMVEGGVVEFLPLIEGKLEHVRGL